MNYKITDMQRVSWFADLRADVRHAFRAWLREPAFAATAILTIALGIGANVAIFSLLDALLLRPLPVRDPGKLIRIGSLENNGMTFAVPGPMLEDLRKEPQLDGVCGVQTPLATVELKGVNLAVGAHALSGDCYSTLGVHAALGRLLTPEDDAPNGPRVAVLSYGFWQEKFGGNPDILGQSIRISGDRFTIVGVTEKSFQGLLLGYPPGISVPISQYFSEGKSAADHLFYWADVLARLKPGANADQVKNASRSVSGARTYTRRMLIAGQNSATGGSMRCISALSPSSMKCLCFKRNCWPDWAWRSVFSP